MRPVSFKLKGCLQLSILGQGHIERTSRRWPTLKSFLSPFGGRGSSCTVSCERLALTVHHWRGQGPSMCLQVAKDQHRHLSWPHFLSRVARCNPIGLSPSGKLGGLFVGIRTRFCLSLHYRRSISCLAVLLNICWYNTIRELLAQQNW